MEIDRDALTSFTSPDQFKLTDLKEDGYAAQRGANLGQLVLDKQLSPELIKALEEESALSNKLASPPTDIEIDEGILGDILSEY